MTRRIELHPILAASALMLSTATLAGCLLKPGDLEAGLDEDDAETSDGDAETGGDPAASECLLGTELDTLGVELSSWVPNCEVTCGTGWGHDGQPLPIEWTVELFADVQDPTLTPRGLAPLPNGQVVAAASNGSGVELNAIDLDGQIVWTRSIEHFGGEFYEVAIDAQTIYLTHSAGENSVLSAFGLDGELRWSASLGAVTPTGLAVSSAGIAIPLRSNVDLGPTELALRDLSGALTWTTDTSTYGGSVDFSPSAELLAVDGGNGDLTIHSSVDGSVVVEIPYEGNPYLSVQSVVFIDEATTVRVGVTIEEHAFDGWASYQPLAGEAWVHTYNRATAWCPPPDPQDTYATGDMFGDVARLSDGTFVVVGSEIFNSEDIVGSHPFVGRFTVTGEFLGSSRGLWDGYASDVVAGADGSALVLVLDRSVPGDEILRLRKYVP
jgi:hypothetical protein